MAKIIGASVDYDDSLPVFGAAVIVHLDNTQVLFLSLESKAGIPVFDVLRHEKRLFSVMSDDDSIYWPNGSRLSLDEIMEILRQ